MYSNLYWKIVNRVEVTIKTPEPEPEEPVEPDVPEEPDEPEEPEEPEELEEAERQIDKAQLMKHRAEAGHRNPLERYQQRPAL